jgi:hypothetical protein
MPYQIIRTVEYKERSDLKYPLSYLGSVDFYSEVQPYYPNITIDKFIEEIQSFSSLIENIHEQHSFFNNTNGLYSYNYNFINPNDRENGIVQTIIYKDKASYDTWQEAEHARAMSTLSQIIINLSEDSSFNASSFSLNDGIIRTDSSTGIIKELPFGPYLMTKFNILRKTICTNVHSVI